jgi:hypothetical protein
VWARLFLIDDCAHLIPPLSLFKLRPPAHTVGRTGYACAMAKKIGYFLSCEQFGPKELIDQAQRAEAAGFQALWISDHFHPWNDEQGQSPFV